MISESKPAPKFLGISFFVMLALAAGLVVYIVLHVRHNMLVAGLFDAAQAGDLVQVEALLGQGLSPDEQDVRWSHQTILMHAAIAGQAAVVTTLLKHGAKADLPYTQFDMYKGRTALIFATEQAANRPGLAEITNILSTLLDHGANVNAHDAFGQTALIFAIEKHQPTLSSFLLEHGAHANVSNWFGKPALMMALESAQFPTALLLIHRDADVNAADEGRTSVSLQSSKGSRFTSFSMNSTNARPGRTPLMAAAENGNREMVELLLQRGARVNARDKHGVTALTIAMTNNFPNIIRQLGGDAKE